MVASMFGKEQMVLYYIYYELSTTLILSSRTSRPLVLLSHAPLPNFEDSCLSIPSPIRGRILFLPSVPPWGRSTYPLETGVARSMADANQSRLGNCLTFLSETCFACAESTIPPFRPEQPTANSEVAIRPQQILLPRITESLAISPPSTRVDLCLRKLQLQIRNLISWSTHGHRMVTAWPSSSFKAA